MPHLVLKTSQIDVLRTRSPLVYQSIERSDWDVGVPSTVIPHGYTYQEEITDPSNLSGPCFEELSLSHQPRTYQNDNRNQCDSVDFEQFSGQRLNLSLNTFSNFNSTVSQNGGHGSKDVIFGRGQGPGHVGNPLVETLKQSYRESRSRKKRNISSNKGYPDDTANASSSSSSFDQKSKVKPKRSFVTDSTQNHNNKTKNKVDHFYVDYSLVREEDIHRKLPISGTPINDILRGVHSIHVHSKGIEVPEGRIVKIFPMKLMSLLSYPQLQKVVSWKQHGRAFVIKDSEAFEKEVWPRFSYPTKFRSFVRQLNMWGFRRLTQGPDLGCYYNEFFLRGKPNLLIKMRCTKIKGVGTKLYPNPADEPNFYELELHRPLPQLSLVTGPLPPKKEV